MSDLWTGRHDIAAALAHVKDDGAPVLLLSHSPDVFPLVPGRVSLTLAAIRMVPGAAAARRMMLWT